MRLATVATTMVVTWLFQYRNRASPHAAVACLRRVTPLSSFNTAIGHHPMRRFDWVGRKLGTQCFNTAIGHHPMQLGFTWISLESLNGCFNTAIGYSPMRQDSENDLVNSNACFNTAIGYSPMRPLAAVNRDFYNVGFNTAIGYSPMRPSIHLRSVSAVIASIPQ